jgi:hypothetical protein
MQDVESLNTAQGTHLFVVTSENENDVFFEKAAAALRSRDIKLDVIVDIPFVFLDTIVLTAFELHFLYVLISSKSVNCLASMGAYC